MCGWTLISYIKLWADTEILFNSYLLVGCSFRQAEQRPPAGQTNSMPERIGSYTAGPQGAQAQGTQANVEPVAVGACVTTFLSISVPSPGWMEVN